MNRSTFSRPAIRFAWVIPVIAAACVMCWPNSWSAAQSAGPATAPATQPAATQPSVAVQAVVDELTNDSFDVRQAAQQKLVDMGPAIEPQLRALLGGDLSDEVRARINGAMRQIEENRILGPATITLHYQDAPLQDVLDDFARQAGADMGTSGPRIRQFARSRHASINLERADFLTALLVVTHAGGLRPGLNGSNALVLMPAQATANTMTINLFNPHRQTIGAFTVFAVSCRQDSSIDYGRGAADQSSTVLQLAAFAEPKLHVIGPANQDWLRECVDEKGQSLAPDVPQSLMGGSDGRQWFWQLQTNLKDAHGSAKMIARVRGELKFTVQTKSEQIEIADVGQLNNLTRTIGASSLILKKFANEGGQYQLHVLVSGPLANDMDQVQSILSNIQILDDKDDALTQGPMSVQPDNVATLELSVNYLANPVNRPRRARATDAAAADAASPLVPRKLRWELTTQTKLVSVPFELDNLELPHGP
jgi:hypothetical protein